MTKDGGIEMICQAKTTDVIDQAFSNGFGTGVLAVGFLFIGLIGLIQLGKINNYHRE